MAEEPQIPDRCVSFKLNPDSGQALLDAEALRTCLGQIVEYVKELQSLTMTRLTQDLKDQVKVLNDDLQVSIKEGCHEVEREMKSKMEGLDEKVGKNENKINDLEAELTKLKKTVKTQASNAAEAQKAMREQAAAAKAAGNDDGGGGGGAAQRSAPAPAPAAEPVGQQVVASGPPPGWEEALKDIEENKYELKNIEMKMSNDIFAIQRKSERIEKRIDEEVEKLDGVIAAHGELEQTCKGFASEINSLQEKAEALDKEKASKTELGESAEEIQRLQGLLNKVDSFSSAMTAQLERCEDKVTKLETLRRDLRDATEKGDKTAEETKTRLDEAKTDLSNFGTRLGTCEQDVSQCAKVLSGRANTADKKIDHLIGAVEVIKTKADLSEVMLLKEAMSGLVQQAREKDTVLFGAKCLSCNRVFDDVDRGAGSVDTHGEQQRAQVLNEVQRALNHPAGDFSKPIKMLSVKVGRTGNIHAGDGSGSYESRETGYGYPLEDVSLMVQTASAVQTGPNSGRHGQPMSARANRTDGLKGIPSVKREDPRHDYKHALHELVGHTPVTSPTRSGTMSRHVKSAGRDEHGMDPTLQPWTPTQDSSPRSVRRFPAPRD